MHERADSTISLAISFVIYLALAICGFSPFASSCKVCEWQEGTCFCSVTFFSHYWWWWRQRQVRWGFRVSVLHSGFWLDWWCMILWASHFGPLGCDLHFYWTQHLPRRCWAGIRERSGFTPLRMVSEWYLHSMTHDLWIKLDFKFKIILEENLVILYTQSNMEG